MSFQELRKTCRTRLVRTKNVIAPGRLRVDRTQAHLGRGLETQGRGQPLRPAQGVLKTSRRRLCPRLMTQSRGRLSSKQRHSLRCHYKRDSQILQTRRVTIMVECLWTAPGVTRLSVTSNKQGQHRRGLSLDQDHRTRQFHHRHS